MKQWLVGILVWMIALGAFASELALPKGVIKVTPRPAPALSLKNLDDETFTLSTKSQRWAFVHFWASWCGPCRREMPSIEALSKQAEVLKLDFFIVNTAETEDIVFSFLGSVAPDVNTLLDLDGLVTENWQPRGLPSTYIVDPKGRIHYVVLGGQNWHRPEYHTFLSSLASNPP